jgi:hypothetical protein
MLTPHKPDVPSSYTVTLPVSIELRAPSSSAVPGVAEQVLALLNASPDVIGIYADMEEADVDPIDLTPELLAKRLEAVESLQGIWAGLPAGWDTDERDRPAHFMDTFEGGTPVHFELPRDFPSLFLALRELVENDERISAASVTEELLAGDALDAAERATLESEVAAALCTLSTHPLFQDGRQGGICPTCGALTPFATAAFREQFLHRSFELRCQECGRTSARSAWEWPGDYRLLAQQEPPPSEEEKT